MKVLGISGSARRRQTPFNADDTSSVFVSPNLVAIDSIDADFLMNQPAVTERNGALIRGQRDTAARLYFVMPFLSV